MRGRVPLPLIAHIAAWGSIGCAFGVLSVPHVWAAFRGYSFPRVDGYHTTDSYMASLLHIHNGSEQLTHALSGLPADQPVAVVLLDGDDEGLLVSHLVTYFAFPREVHSFALTRANAAAQMRALGQKAVGAVFFCRVAPPPAMKPVTSIGSDLRVFVPPRTPDVPPR